MQLAASAGASPVVVGLVLGHHGAQVAFAEDQRPGGEHEPLGMSVRTGAPGRDFHRLDAGGGQHGIEGIGELPGPVANQELKVRGAVTEIHQEVADLLGGPRAVRIRGHAKDMHVAGAGFHDEQAVQAAEAYCAVDVEEIGGEHGRGLSLQELPPGRIGVPLRCRGDRQCPEDPADRGGADPVAELEELALDPLVPPGAVLGGELPGERGDLGADRRPARPVRISPLARDQAAMPPEHGAGCHQAVHPRRSGQEADQRSEHRAVRPVQPWPRLGAAQHGDLVPQHQQLDVLGRRRAAEQDQPAAQPDEDQVEQANEHG